MNLIDFIEWCRQPEIYSWAMNSCKEAFFKIFEEDK